MKKCYVVLLIIVSVWFVSQTLYAIEPYPTDAFYKELYLSYKFYQIRYGLNRPKTVNDIIDDFDVQLNKNFRKIIFAKSFILEYPWFHWFLKHQGYSQKEIKVLTFKDFVTMMNNVFSKDTYSLYVKERLLKECRMLVSEIIVWNYSYKRNLQGISRMMIFQEGATKGVGNCLDIHSLRVSLLRGLVKPRNSSKLPHLDTLLVGVSREELQAIGIREGNEAWENATTGHCVTVDCILEKNKYRWVVSEIGSHLTMSKMLNMSQYSYLQIPLQGHKYEKPYTWILSNASLSFLSDPENTFAKNLLFQNYLASFQQAKKYNEAVVFFKVAQAQFLNDSVVKIYLAEAYCLLANSYKLENKYQKAKEIFCKVLEIVPDHALAKNNAEAMCDRLGANFFNEHNYEKAIQEYLEATKINPSQQLHKDNIASCYQSYGVQCFSSCQYEKAIEFFTKGLSYSPNKKECYFNRAFSYYQLGNYREAINDFRAVFKLYPTCEHIKHNLYVISSKLAQNYYTEKKYQKALDLYNELLLLYPDKTSNKNNIVVVSVALSAQFASEKKLDKAFKVYEIANSKNLGDAKVIQKAFVDAYARVAYAFIIKKQYQDAVDVYYMARKIDANNSHINYNLGFTLVELGKQYEKKSEELLEKANVMRTQAILCKNCVVKKQWEKKIDSIEKDAGEVFKKAKKMYYEALSLGYPVPERLLGKLKNAKFYNQDYQFYKQTSHYYRIKIKNYKFAS